MRVVIVIETFSRNMGYLENNLPKALVRLGADVHVVSTNLQTHYNDPNYREAYEPCYGRAIQSCGSESVDGFTLHRLSHRILLRHVRIEGLAHKLRSLRPDIVQTEATASWNSLEAAVAQPYIGYKLFTGAHQHASVFSDAARKASRWSLARLESDFYRALPGRIVSLFSEKCYAITVDCAEIAVRFYGVPQAQIDICPLGVDTDLFKPVDDDEASRSRSAFRQALGIRDSEILCVYSGKFSDGKNPFCLAQAVAALRKRGELFRGLFVGGGDQQAAIQTLDGCIVRPFVAWRELPPFYRAADIAVWPTQESLSMLDAAACGTPVVVSDRLMARERVDGNGLTYKEGEPEALAEALLSLKDSKVRRPLGNQGAIKIATHYSWTSMARKRLEDYEAALRGSR